MVRARLKEFLREYIRIVKKYRVCIDCPAFDGLDYIIRELDESEVKPYLKFTIEDASEYLTHEDLNELMKQVDEEGDE